MYGIYYCPDCQDFFINWGEANIKCSICNKNKNVVLIRYYQESTSSQKITEGLRYVQEHRLFFLEFAKELISKTAEERKSIEKSYYDVMTQPVVKDWK